ncbi:MAG: RraA family protein, partial [Firmicutes bacterium]|nr:RraA family protein [Bacillota bacterium]
MEVGSIKGWLEIPTGNICDANNKGGNMDCGIKAVSPGMKLAGPAFTVNCHPGDNLALHQAILEAAPGDVIVANAHSYCGAGHFGEIMAVACLEKGIAGLILDGGCRDAEDLRL